MNRRKPTANGTRLGNACKTGWEYFRDSFCLSCSRSSTVRVTVLSAANLTDMDMLSSLGLSKPKRTKTSGLTSVELRVAYRALLRVKAGLKQILVPGSKETPSGLVVLETDFEETLDSLIQSLEIKIEQTDVCLLLCQTYTFTYHCLHPSLSLE